MFLPSHVRLLSIGVYAHSAWLFLSVGAIAATGGFLAAIEGRSIAIGLLIVATPLVFVGIEALRHLRNVLTGPRLGL